MLFGRLAGDSPLTTEQYEEMFEIVKEGVGLMALQTDIFVHQDLDPSTYRHVSEGRGGHCHKDLDPSTGSHVSARREGGALPLGPRSQYV